MKLFATLLLLMTGMAWGQAEWPIDKPCPACPLWKPEVPILQAELPDAIPYEPDIMEPTDYWEHIKCDHGGCTITPEVYYPPRIKVPEPKELKRGVLGD